MLTRFNIYDLYGHFVPGSVFLIITYALTVKWGIGIDLPSESWSILALTPLAYVIGYFINQIARFMVHANKYDYSLLRDPLIEIENADQLPAEPLPESIRKKLEILIRKHIGIDIRTNDPRSQKELIKSAFDICYYDVIQSKDAVYVENFNASYGMCRSMVVILSFVIFSNIVASLARFESLSVFEKSLDLIFLPFLLSIIAFFFHRAMNHNAMLFVLSVYRSFIASKGVE